MTTDDKRLIEDYLPINALNAIAAKEKKHPKHYVALVHYWPARRPITACRAAIYATLVAAPTSDAEREEAAKFVTELAAYEVTSKSLTRAIAAIRSHHQGRKAKVLDLFSGGGAIPLEAARLGCESHALEYNPVAHLIELCTLVYPQRFGVTLAEDLQRWGKKVIERVREATADLYPQVRIPGSAQVQEQIELFGEVANRVTTGQQCQPVAYIWVRAVPCRKPGCAAIVPLVRQAWLRKKEGSFVASVPRPTDQGRQLEWEIVSGTTSQDVGSDTDEQTGAGESGCPECTTPTPSNYVKECALAGRLQEVLATVVVDGGRSKIYLPPPVTPTLPSLESLSERLTSLETELAMKAPDEELKGKLRDQLPSYGFTRFRDLFTPRQLVVLMELTKNIRAAHLEMITEGMAAERATAVTTFLGMAFGRLANSFTKFCRWQASDQITITAIGDRQALKMVYDFSEINPFAETAGCLSMALDNEIFCIRKLATVETEAIVTRGSAEGLHYQDATFDAVITDPPYYSSIFYADLSSFFYVWLRRNVGDLYPEHFALPAPPKKREAVAQATEHEGDGKRAERHYRELMQRAFSEARRVLKPGCPLVCVYAHKTTEGWASLIKALVPAGLTVTEAWPIQTEAKGRTNANKAAALSDSIFLVARRRETTATGQYESEVQPALERIARERIKTLWANGKGIGGADLLMAAIGAGLRPYTQFAKVEYANGDEVPPESFLREVEGVVLDIMLEEIFGFTKAGVSSVDALTRFYILWRFTYRESGIDAGDAFVFCYTQGIELDGHNGVSGALPALVEKVRNSYRTRTFAERGNSDKLGLATEKGQAAPLIDILHRTLWLMEKRPTELGGFLRESQPNREQLRLVAQALGGPTLRGSEITDISPTAELSALGKLTANWQSVIEDAVLPVGEREEKKTGQKQLL